MITGEEIALTLGSKTLFEALDFRIEEGRKYAFTGDSGSGKSSLLRLILGLQRTDKGVLKYKESEYNKSVIQKIRNTVFWMPQNVNFVEGKVYDFLLSPFEFASNKADKPKDARVDELIAAFLLDTDVLEKDFSELSGGERQRIFMISALLSKRKILLMDEPTAAVDDKIIQVFLNHFLKNEHLTIVIVTHDNRLIEACDQVLEIKSP